MCSKILSLTQVTLEVSQTIKENSPLELLRK